MYLGVLAKNSRMRTDRLLSPNILLSMFQMGWKGHIVTKGFNAKYSVKGTLNYTTIAVRIEIKKDNEPFVVKKENLATSHGYPCYCSVSYIIE